MDTTKIIHNALDWANKRLELQGEPITKNQRNYIVFALRQQLPIPDISVSLPERNSGEMWSFLLVNALKCLNEEQRAGLCFDLYSRSELTESIDNRISKLKKQKLWI